MLVHSGDKPHECPECGKRFSHLGYIKTHMLVHSGDKPHECPECGKRFSQRRHIKTHMLVHSGDKPHECPECGKRFSHLDSIKSHITMALIKINSASAAELQLLPGVGDTLAARIIKFRHRHVITEDNIYDINRLRATPDLMAAISFEADPSQQGPGPSGQGAGSRSSSSSSETGTRRSSRGAASGRQRGRRPQSPAYSRASGRQGTRQGSPSHHRSTRSRRRTARHSSHSSRTSDSDASLSRSRRTGYRQQKETFRTPPRALDYDGKSDWATFYCRFTSYASEKDWSGPTLLTQLGWCLKGKRTVDRL
ncbi:zinc finger protein 391-like [Procambarus clarkii]|uniref:zinc finger protein 391-like n=1 Tax=Procambarus clarkii TaxID=6728 RepID=UPI0037426FF7